VKSKRPIHYIEPDKVDLLLELITLICLFISTALPLLYYAKLPDEIPIHFNLKGLADGFADKYFIFLLPLLTLCQYVLLKYLNRRPHKYHYPTVITEENAVSQYTAATKMIRMLNLFCTALFTYLTLHIIRSSKHDSVSLGPYLIPIMMVLLAALIGYFYFKAKKKH